MHNTHSSPAFLVLDGRLVRSDQLSLSAEESATMIGQGVFETLAAYYGVPFQPEAHFARLAEGAKRLNLKLPAIEQLNSQLGQLIEANELSTIPKIRLRITISPNHSFIISSVPPPYPPLASLFTVPFVRNERSALVGFKTVNYGENVAAQQMAEEHGADEALFLNTRDNLCEGTWSNLFVRLEGRWTTPPLESGCLPGVTRELVLNLQDDELPQIEEANIHSSKIPLIDAAFLTSSIREIQLVGVLDGRTLMTPELPEIEQWQRAFQALLPQKE